jgi:hypothetical protein
MRGAADEQTILFGIRSIENRMPRDHPLRGLRRLVDPVLCALSLRVQVSGSGYPALRADEGRGG